MTGKAKGNGRVLRLCREELIDPYCTDDRHLLRRLAQMEAAEPTDLMRVTHRGGLVVYRLDRLARVRIVTEYRCGYEDG